MFRALAVLVGAAFVTLVLGVVASGRPAWVLPLGAVFTVLGTAGFEWVRRRGSLPWAVAYVAVQLGVGFVVFAADPGVASTLFLVVVVSQSVLLLPLPGAAVVVALTPFVHLGMPGAELLREGFGTLAAALFAATITELLRREQRSRRDLAEAHARLQEYATQAERLATAQERNRLARDIHDGLGHLLTVVQMQVKAARAVLGTDPDRADTMLVQAQHQSEEALAEVRRSVRALREARAVPPLDEALSALADESSAAGLPTRLTVSGAVRPLPEEARAALFRAAQEGLTNVRKHAGAAHADLLLDYADGVVRVEVGDDGTGLGEEPHSGFGLLGLRERATRVGGRFDVRSVAGGGTTLGMEVPG